MKKTLAILTAVALAGSAFSAANDALVSFSTEGPDKYADGSFVLDGECYALVWTPAGSEGVTVAADGSAAGGEIVLAAPVASGRRCPKVLFEIDAKDMEEKYKDGAWSVVLLDTRRWAAEGTAKPAGTVNGKARLVNATGAVVGDVKVATGAASVMSGVRTVASDATAIPEGAEAKRPKIEGIKVDGANVYVTVRGTVPYLQYGLLEKADPGADGAKSVGGVRTGAATEDERIVLVAPATNTAAFFMVGRRQTAEK